MSDGWAAEDFTKLVIEKASNGFIITIDRPCWAANSREGRIVASDRAEVLRVVLEQLALSSEEAARKAA